MPPGMDVDDEDDGTQRPLEARDYGIEVDFSDLSEDERDVSSLSLPRASASGLADAFSVSLQLSFRAGRLGRIRS